MLPGAPLIAVFDEWVIQEVSSIIRRVPRDLIRIYGFHDYHYITCSCYQRKPFMGSVYARDVFVEVFDRVRATDAKTRSKPRRPTLRLCAPCENHAECGTHFLGITRRKLRSREGHATRPVQQIPSSEAVSTIKR